MQNMESRIAAVERQMRLHRFIIIFLLIALVALVGYGAMEDVPDEIRAKSFVMLNDDGKPVWVARSDDSGNGSMGLINQEGSPIILMFASPSGDGAITVYRSGSSSGGVKIGAFPQGGWIGVFNSQGLEAVTLGTDDSGSGFVSVLDDNGNSIGGFPVVRASTDRTGQKSKSASRDEKSETGNKGYTLNPPESGMIILKSEEQNGILLIRVMCKTVVCLPTARLQFLDADGMPVNQVRVKGEPWYLKEGDVGLFKIDLATIARQRVVIDFHRF